MEDRRKFLVQSSVFFLGVAGLKPAVAKDTEKTVQWSMIIDLNRCTGCQACVIACKNRNHTARGKFNCSVKSHENRDQSLLFMPIQCNQCDKPSCVEACTEQATFQLKNGIVVTDWSRCQGHGDCIDACPFAARFADPAHGNRVDKCDFCLERITENLLPSCVEACSSGARLFGNIHAPEGEFGSCLKRPDLTTRDPDSIRDAAVKYIPNRRTEGGIL